MSLRVIETIDTFQQNIDFFLANVKIKKSGTHDPEDDLSMLHSKILPPKV